MKITRTIPLLTLASLAPVLGADIPAKKSSLLARFCSNMPFCNNMPLLCGIIGLLAVGIGVYMYQRKK